MSGGLLGRWRLCVHAVRAARGLWALVEGGALAHARHGLGVPCARGPVLGNARGWDREWRWTVGCLPDMLARLAAAPSLLSTMGWQGCARLFTIDGNGKLTGVLVLS